MGEGAGLGGGAAGGGEAGERRWMFKEGLGEAEVSLIETSGWRSRREGRRHASEGKKKRRIVGRRTK